MMRYFRGRLRSLRHGDSGFTLVELLVVVGIIVALAAVIIPNVASFANRGDQGAEAAEFDNIQAAMDAMMADKSITVVAANHQALGDNGNAIWTAMPSAGNPLFSVYLRQSPTAYWYCWDTSGLVVEQLLATGTACTL